MNKMKSPSTNGPIALIVFGLFETASIIYNDKPKTNTEYESIRQTYYSLLDLIIKAKVIKLNESTE